MTIPKRHIADAVRCVFTRGVKKKSAIIAGTGMAGSLIAMEIARRRMARSGGDKLPLCEYAMRSSGNTSVPDG